MAFAIIEALKSTIPSWLSSPTSPQDALKIAGLCTVGIVALHVGNLLKFHLRESLYEYNWSTTAKQVIHKSKINFKNKVAIVTGSNSGIGKETAKQLYLAGCIVIMACRNLKKANIARDDILSENTSKNNPDNLIIIRLDLGDLKTIDQFIKEFNENKIVNGKLDYLVNNAGVMGFKEFGVTKTDGLDEHFGINHMGHFYLTNKLLSIIKKNKTRIVNLSSNGQSIITAEMMRDKFLNTAKDIKPARGPSPEMIPYETLTYYGIAKLCNFLFTRHINSLFYKEYGVLSIAVHPGGVNTNLFSEHVSWFWYIILKVLFLGQWKSVENGASTTIRALTISEEEVFNGNIGDFKKMGIYFADARPANYEIAKDFQNWKNTDIDKELWEYSERIIKSYDYLKLEE